MTVAEAVEPRVLWVPDSVSSAGEEAVDLARFAGLELDAWQALVLSASLGERGDGKWAAFEVGLVVPRQNGKDATIEARQLAGLFLLGERLIIHSAHQFDTALEAFRRVLFLIENTPELDSRVKRVSKAHGEEGVELKSGQRLRFRTRTKGGGRGFSGDLLILNEAMIMPEASLGALMPTLSARPNPQIWYTGSAVDQSIHSDGVVLARVRERGMRGGDQRLMYAEWSAECVDDQGVELRPDQVPAAFLEDEENWGRANPGIGIRITREHVRSELAAMDPRTFCVERLGIGDWPATDGSAGSVIKPDVWAALEDRSSAPLDPVALAFDVMPDRSWASVVVCGAREDGLEHVEVVDRRRGTAWVVSRVAEIVGNHRPAVIVADGVGAAASLIPQLEARGVQVATVSAQEHARACGAFYDAVTEDRIRHLGTVELTAAVKGASKRPLGDSWAWSRKSSSTDISPLVAATLAHWGRNHMAHTAPFIL